jgi:hypothetical protein
MIFAVSLFSILIGGMNIAGGGVQGFMTEKKPKENWIGTFPGHVGSEAMSQGLRGCCD